MTKSNPNSTNEIEFYKEWLIPDIIDKANRLKESLITLKKYSEKKDLLLIIKMLKNLVRDIFDDLANLETRIALSD